MNSLKKFWFWLTKQPYIVYVGKNRYECRVRTMFGIQGIDQQGDTWTSPEDRQRHCYKSLDDAENIRFDYRMVGDLHT